MPGDLRDQNTERLEVISKPNSGVNLNHPGGVYVCKELPSFLKVGMGGLDKSLLIPLKPPLGKGRFTSPYPNL